jgi:putative oxidoreductase
MTDTNSYLALLGRALLSFMFIFAGFDKLADLPGAMAYTASGGLPGFLVFPAIAIEIGGGIAVLAGWHTRWAALALAAFSMLTGLIYHFVPALGLEGFERIGQMTMFYKNLAIAGGFVLLAAQGPGRVAIDGRMATA